MAGKTTKCPFCGEDILAVAIKCKHCSSDLDSSSAEKNSKGKSSILVNSFWLIIAIALVVSLITDEEIAIDDSVASTSTAHLEPVEVSNGLWGLEFGMTPEEAGRVANDTVRCGAIRNESASCTLLENNNTVLLSFRNQQIDAQNCCVGEGGELSNIYMNMGQYTRASARELLDQLNIRYEQVFEPADSERSQWMLGEGSMTYFFENKYVPERPRYLYLEISRAYFDLFNNLRQDMDLYYVAESVGLEMLAERESRSNNPL